MAKAAAPKKRQTGKNDEEVRVRILDAAFAAFKTNGYAATSTLEIATRARVSKRELYGLVGNKEEILRACITRRARRMQLPAELPTPRDRQTLEKVLLAMGTQLLRETSEPTVVAAFRLAIGEAVHAPEVARILNSIGIETGRAALREIMSRALASRLLEGEAADLAQEFGALLWRDQMMQLLLGVKAQPEAGEIAERARQATAAFLRIHPAP